VNGKATRRFMRGVPNVEAMLSEPYCVRAKEIRALFFVEHDPEKWEPVFGKDHAQSKS
jgi:hypothetical protein